MKKLCTNCGIPIWKLSKTGLCLSCFNKLTKTTLKNRYCKNCNKLLSRYSNSIRCYSCASKYKLKIKGNWLMGKGKKHPGYKDGRSLKKYYCINCNKKISNWSGIYGGSRCCSCSKKGNFPYPLEFSKELKLKIRQRDNFECQNCNMTEEENISVYGRVLEIHHIDYNKENCKEENLISLCQGCNIRANFNRDYWIEYFKEIMCSFKR